MSAYDSTVDLVQSLKDTSFTWPVVKQFVGNPLVDKLGREWILTTCGNGANCCLRLVPGDNNELQLIEFNFNYYKACRVEGYSVTEELLRIFEGCPLQMLGRCAE